MSNDERTSLVNTGPAPPKLLIERRTEGVVSCLRLSGVIDEQFDGPGLALTVRARWAILDLGGVDRISSFGIRQWMDFVAGLRVEGVYFVECSPKIVDQFNMVANFGGKGHVVSFYAPYRCDTCDHDRRRLLRTDEETPLWRAGQAPAFACPICGNPEYFDEDPATYFSFVAQQPQVAMPKEVIAFLRAELSYGQGGQRKLKIEKRVEGRITCVKLSGDLDSDLRAQKLAEGLEGDVVFDLSGVLSIDPVGTAQWRKLLQLLERGGSEQVDRVHLVAVPPLFLERLGRPDDLTRKGQVLSVLVPYICPRCRATTQRLVDCLAYSAELRNGRVPRTQCASCGSPTQCVASETWLARLSSLPQPQIDDSLRQCLGRLTAAPAPAPAKSPPSLAQPLPPARTEPPRPAEPAAEAPRRQEVITRQVETLRQGSLGAHISQVLQVPGILPGILVVLLALSGAIVYRILAPPEGRRNPAGWLVLDASHAKPPDWVRAGSSELVFVGRSSILPDRESAKRQAEVAALAELAQRLGGALASENAAFRATVQPLYAGAEQEARAASRLRVMEAEGRVAAALRQALAGTGPQNPTQYYWEKLQRSERVTTREVAYQAMARVEISRPAFTALVATYGRAEGFQRTRALPYFPMLGWRYDLPGGAILIEVDPQSRLATGGLRPGDIVLSVHGREVRTVADLGQILEQLAAAPEPGAVPIKLQRGDRLLDVQLPGSGPVRRRAKGR